MNTRSVQATLAALVATDPSCADGDELAGLVASSASVRAWLDAYDLRCGRRSTELAASGRSDTAAGLLATHGSRSSKDAAAVTERDRACTSAPTFEDALASGAVSAGHVDALAAATKRLDSELRD